MVNSDNSDHSVSVTVSMSGEWMDGADRKGRVESWVPDNDNGPMMSTIMKVTWISSTVKLGNLGVNTSLEDVGDRLGWSACRLVVRRVSGVKDG